MEDPKVEDRRGWWQTKAVSVMPGKGHRGNRDTAEEEQIRPRTNREGSVALHPQSEMELIGSNIIGSGRIPDVVRYNSMRFDPIRQMGLYLDQE